MYAATLPDSLVSSNSFLVVSFGFSRYSLSSGNHASFTSFSIWIPCISFSSLIAVVGHPKSMLNSCSESRQACLLPDLSGNLSVFHHWQWCSPWLYHMCLLLCCIRIHICPLPGAFLSEMSIGFCQKHFSACVERLIQCLFFSLLMWLLKTPWYITLNHAV